MIFLGAYVPLTMEGNIVVDGILASCYASVDHDLAHFGMILNRWLPETIEWIFGQSGGLPPFVGSAKAMGRWILPSWQLFI